MENAGNQSTHPVSPVAGIITICLTVEIFHHDKGPSGWPDPFRRLARTSVDWGEKAQRLGGSTPGVLETPTATPLGNAVRYLCSIIRESRSIREEGG